jgi:hypothetical protein
MLIATNTTAPIIVRLNFIATSLFEIGRVLTKNLDTDSRHFVVSNTPANNVNAQRCLLTLKGCLSANGAQTAVRVHGALDDDLLLRLQIGSASDFRNAKHLGSDLHFENATVFLSLRTRT